MAFPGLLLFFKMQGGKSFLFFKYRKFCTAFPIEVHDGLLSMVKDLPQDKKRHNLTV